MIFAKVSDILHKEASYKVKKLIGEANGIELFFYGITDRNGLTVDVELIAAGNKTSVPAILQNLKSGFTVIHNHPAGDLMPSDADVEIASIVGNNGCGFYIVNNDVTKVSVIVKPFLKKEKVRLDSNEIQSCFIEGSPLSKILKGYEFRGNQVNMSLQAAEAFNHGKIAILEAGTGIGKSLAYLIPSALWSFKNNERVVISTNTINLQEQLLFKDTPLVKKIISKELKIALIKGRRNYICIRKLNEAAHNLTLFEDDEKFLLKSLAEWAEVTADGSLTDLPVQPKESVWDEVVSEGDTCLKSRCHYYDRCFFFKARREAASSNLIIANHHLLLSEIAIRSTAGGESYFIPLSSRLIIDEAHNLADVSTAYFGVELTKRGLLKQLGRLINKKKTERGVLPSIKNRLLKNQKKIPSPTFIQFINLIENEITTHRDEIAVESGELFDRIQYFGDKVSEKNKEWKVRLNKKNKQLGEWDAEVVPSITSISYKLNKLSEKIKKLTGFFEDLDDVMKKEFGSQIVEIKALAGRFEVYASQFLIFAGEEDGNIVEWAELTGRKAPQAKLCSAPLEIGSYLRESVFNSFETVILTSATLSTSGTFVFFETSAGLDEIPAERKIYGIHESPFNLRENSLIAVPSDIDQPSGILFIKEASAFLNQYIEKTGGGALILMTSFAALEELHSSVKEHLQSKGFAVYRQGDMTRHRLLSGFKKDGKGVLFGVDSFWEGIDVRGDALKSVIIGKLPFDVPTEPVLQARVEALDNSGKNSFIEFTIPRAVIKLKQGIGRLIRSKKDRGIIVILDRRIIEKYYGRYFLKSLETYPLFTGTCREVIDKSVKFFSKIFI